MSDELFELAVGLIRKGVGYVDLINELEQAASPSTDVRDVINAASKHVEETRKAAFECAVEAFKHGESFFNVCKKLEKCGFHPWDSQQVAGRAKAKADAEAEANAVRRGNNE